MGCEGLHNPTTASLSCFSFLKSPTSALCSWHTKLLLLSQHALWCDSGLFNFLFLCLYSESPHFCVEKLVIVQNIIYPQKYFLPPLFPLSIPSFSFFSSSFHCHPIVSQAKKWFLYIQLIIYVPRNISAVPHCLVYICMNQKPKKWWPINYC